MKMSKIDELIESGIELYDRSYIQTKSTPELMKEYAEWYAIKCLKVAAENADIRKEFTMGFGDSNVYFVSETEENGYIMSVNKESILNIKLPEHE